MSVRRFVRGTVPWDRLESVFREFAERYDDDAVRVEFLDADNWFSTPCVVRVGDERWFVKIISPQNAFVHSLFTGMRNLGIFSAGTEGFFEPFEGAPEMARHELEAADRMRNVGLNVPKPVEAFEVDDLGVFVMEFLPDFETLDDLGADRVEARAADVFGALATMHDNDLAHGDLRSENVLVYEGQIYLIDATKVDDDGIDAARAYDLACALAVFESLIGAEAAVAAAGEHYGTETLLEAREFVDFVGIRPDHDFDAGALKTEIEAVADDD